MIQHSDQRGVVKKRTVILTGHDGFDGLLQRVEFLRLDYRIDARSAAVLPFGPDAAFDERGVAAMPAPEFHFVPGIFEALTHLPPGPVVPEDHVPPNPILGSPEVPPNPILPFVPPSPIINDLFLGGVEDTTLLGVPPWHYDLLV
jgi:hypothetical protein